MTKKNIEIGWIKNDQFKLEVYPSKAIAQMTVFDIKPKPEVSKVTVTKVGRKIIIEFLKEEENGKKENAKRIGKSKDR